MAPLSVMIHLIRTVTILVLCLLAFTCSAEHPSLQDTSACTEFMEQVERYSYRYDANDSLRFFAEQLLRCADSIGDNETYMEGLSVLGVTYLRDNDYSKALDVFNENRKMAQQLNDHETEAKVLVNLSSVYTATDSSRKAMELLIVSADLFEQVKDSTMLMYVYNNIAILFGKIRNREEQLHYSKKAFSMVGGLLNHKLSLTLGANLSINYLNSGMVDSAEVLGLQVLEKSRELKNAKIITQILTHLANIANRKGEYERAVDYCNEALEYEGIIKHSHTFAQLYTYRGIAFLNTERVEEAIENLEKAFGYAKEEKSLQRQELVAKHLQKAYVVAGEYEKAYETLLYYKQASDSLASEENIKILNDLETKYETEKKEQQIKDLAQEQQISELKIRHRNIWIIVVLTLAIAVAGGIFFVSRQKLLKEQQDALENKLLSLRVQLNPHFIFNALTAVQNYMLSGKDLRQATRYLSNFAKVMRAFLEYNQEETISLDKELHALGLYVGIQELRFSNGFEFEVNVDEQIMPEETVVPPMIMQPLIENSIEHGLRNIENGKISLSYKLIGDRLEIRLEDNGIGRKQAAKESHKAENKTSLATKITNERISLLNRKGNGKYRFSMEDANSDGTGTVAIFTIPYLQS